MISKKIKETKFYSLGGIQEIGKSSLVVEHDDEVILIDCGIRFANSIETGVQGIIPNYSVLKDKNVVGLFITHGHEDHIGGIPYLIQQVKLKYIYASNISIAYIRNRLNSMKIKTNIKFVEINKDFKFKSKHMTITSWTAQHSIPEAYGIIVKTINGTIMSTGDFRFDYSPINGVLTDFVKLKKLSEEGLTILCSDSTNSLIPFHSPTEQKIINDLEKYIKEAKGKIVFTTFASNVNRIKIAIDLAVKYNKKIIAFGKSMIKGLDVARNLK
ncbi:MAG: ribonuclease J, partial [Mycoplasma sp.]|nr:ribonuclease J [Mycoplasma sp.]